MARRHQVRTAANLASAVRSASRPGSPGLLQRVAALPRMIRAVRDGRYTGMTNGQLAVMLLGLGYVLSPIDVVPEGLLLVAGLVDDAVVLSWLALSLVKETEAFIEWERAVQATAGASPQGPAGYGTPVTVPSEVVRD